MDILKLLGLKNKKESQPINKYELDIATIYETGQRPQNEDYFFPQENFAKAIPDLGHLFIVCDGIGGAEKGEVASKLVCEKVYQHLSQQKDLTDPPALIQAAVDQGMLALYDYIKAEPMSNGLGTTFTFLWLKSGQAYIAHIGDSRVYLFRDQKIVHVTKDHSHVNDLVGAGLITAERALTHPKRNIITRAMAAKIDPEHPKPKMIKADITLIDTLFENDQFFLCTDGIQESFTDPELLEVFNANNTPEDKATVLKEKCAKQSKDNHTAFIIQLK